MGKTLVIGASERTDRYANMAIRSLRQKGFEVVAQGITEGMVLDVPIKKELVAYNDVETVTLYINPYRQQSFYDYIVSLAPKRVIFNPGTENYEFYEILKTNAIIPEVACTLVMLSTNQY